MPPPDETDDTPIKFLLSADTIRRLNDALAPAGSEERSLLASISNHVAARGAKTLCTMLNQRGGRVFIGVDAHNQLRGQEVTVKTLEDIAPQHRQPDESAQPAPRIRRQQSVPTTPNLHLIAHPHRATSRIRSHLPERHRSPQPRIR